MRASLVLMMLFSGCHDWDSLLTAFQSDGALIDGGSDRNAGPLRVFVTSGTSMGNFGGRPGGDALCQSAAAGLGGTWLAWLSIDGSSQNDRITGDGPWTLLDRSLAFDGSLPRQPVRSIDVSENGPITAADDSVWTGPSTVTPPSLNCGNWTDSSAHGRMGHFMNPSAWTDVAQRACNQAAHLYCFEVRR